MCVGAAVAWGDGREEGIFLRNQESPTPSPPFLILSWSPALQGLRGRGQLVAMVPDCLGLLSDPWGLPRVCKEGEGTQAREEVQCLPFPKARKPKGGGPTPKTVTLNQSVTFSLSLSFPSEQKLAGCGRDA